jgi:signal transduction histidine kinase/HAMP domain-containing protein
MRIATRLRIISGVTTALLLVLAPVLVWSSIEFKKAKDDFVLADAIQDNLFERDSFRDQYFLYREERARLQWEQGKKKIEGLLRQARLQFKDESETDILDRLGRNDEDRAIIFQRIVDCTKALQAGAGNREVYEELDKRLASQLLVKAAAARNMTSALQEVASRRVEQRFKFLSIVIGCFAVALIIATNLASRQVGHLIRRRLAPLHTGAKIIADGNLDHRVNSGGADEFSELAVSVNEMTARLQSFTQKLEAELQAHQLTEIALQETQRDLLAVQRLSHVGNWRWDIRSDQHHWSEEIFAIYGRDPARGPAAYPEVKEYFTAESWQSLGAAVEQCLAEGGHYQCDAEVCRPDGQQRWILVFGEAVRDDQGEIVTLRGTVQDITKRKQAEAEILRSNTELEQFGYAISHDMRQPLRMISSYLQLLERSLKEPLDAKQQEYFRFAVDGAKRLDTMLVGLLEYSRIGRKGEAPTWVNSRSLIDDALLFLQVGIAEAQAAIDIGGDWPRLLANPNELLSLVQNLIGNAVKFRVDERRPEISVSSEIRGRRWRLRIADNGIGIDPKHAHELFQVFRRLHPRSTYEGSGIGLALCRRIVEHHGGRVWVESAGENQGSVFSVDLPIEAASRTPVPAAATYASAPA